MPAKAVDPYLGGAHEPGRFEYGFETLPVVVDRHSGLSEVVGLGRLYL